MNNQRITPVAVAAFISALMLVGAGCAKPAANPDANGNGGNAVVAPSPVPPAGGEPADQGTGSGGTGGSRPSAGDAQQPDPTPTNIDTRFPLTYRMSVVGDSRQSGTVTLTGLAGDKTKIDIQLNDIGAASQYAAVYAGSCADATFFEAYRLPQLIKGFATATLDINVNDLIAKPYMVKVKRDGSSATQAYTSCGNLR